MDTVIDLLTDRFGGEWHELPSTMPHGMAMMAQVKPARSGRKILTGVLLLGDALTAEDLRKVPVTGIENGVNADVARSQLASLGPLKRTDGMASEDFSKHVAEHYRLWAQAMPHPATAMAAEYGVKLPTMHSWIREARLRGLLPEARRGKRSSGISRDGA